MRTKDPARLRPGLERLAQAVRDHAEWQQAVLHAIVSGDPLRPCDYEQPSYLQCPFHRSYFDRSSMVLWGYPAFARLGVEHWRQHRVADELLDRLATDASVFVEDFDELMTGDDRLARVLAALRQEVEAAWRGRDALTGACGRDTMIAELREWRELALQGVQKCCVVRMEVDGLQEIRDRHGPALADEVLAAAVRFTARRLRPWDKVFRLGGEEFLLSLPGADLAIGQSVIRRVREGLAARPPVAVPGAEALGVTASFGLALLDPEASVEDVVERADQALLLAKTAGRNRAINWDPSVTTGARLPRLRLEDVKQ
jgi:diguanylate cyclase (GGDEF)-like protein